MSLFNRLTAPLKGTKATLFSIFRLGVSIPCGEETPVRLRYMCQMLVHMLNVMYFLPQA